MIAPSIAARINPETTDATISVMKPSPLPPPSSPGGSGFGETASRARVGDQSKQQRRMRTSGIRTGVKAVQSRDSMLWRGGLQNLFRTGLVWLKYVARFGHLVSSRVLHGGKAHYTMHSCAKTTVADS